MDNLIQLAMQIIFCLLIAAILGAIIGYLLGKMSKCDKDEYNNDDDFHGSKKQKEKLHKLNDYSEHDEVHHRENIVSSGLSRAETVAATGVAGVTAAGAGLLGGAKDIGSNVVGNISDAASNVSETGSDMFNRTKEAGSDMFNHTKDAGSDMLHNTKEAGSNLRDNMLDSGERQSRDFVRDDLTTTSASIGQEIGIRPQSIQSPMGEADDLKEISGVGLKIEEVLNTLGIYHFEQISEWNPENVEWIENYLSVKRRVVKEDWIGQAKLLAAGGQTEFSKKVRRGDNRNY